MLFSLGIVQAHNIPMECYYLELAKLLGFAAGESLQIDWLDTQTKNLDFFRFKICIPTNEPLIPGAFIELPEDGYHWVLFRYERVFQICYKW